MPTFLDNYMTYNEGNEVNAQYHYWSGLSALSAIVSRKVWVDMGYFTIYPSLYVVLLGPPGNGKTTAMRISKRVVNDVGGVDLSADCQSVSDLVTLLARDDSQRSCILPDNTPLIYTPLSLFLSELSNFIAIDPTGMIDFLVGIYDTDDRFVRRTNKHGEQVVLSPCLTLLGCTVPDTIQRYLKNDIVTGGFTRRAIFVLEDWNERRIPFPELTDAQKAAGQACVDWGRKIQQVTGRFILTQSAAKWWDLWYRKRKISTDMNVAAFDRTKPTQLLKVAMLLQLARSTDLRIDTDILDEGLRILDSVLVRLPEVFSFVGRNELAAVGGKVETLLRRNGPMPSKEVKALLWRDANGQEISQILLAMIENGHLKLYTVNEREWLTLPDQEPELRRRVAKSPVPLPPELTKTD